MSLRELPPILSSNPPPGGEGGLTRPYLGPKFAPRSFFTSLNTLKHFQNVLERFGDVSGHLNHIFIIFLKIMIFCVFSLIQVHRVYTGITQELGIERFKSIFRINTYPNWSKIIIVVSENVCTSPNHIMKV